MTYQIANKPYQLTVDSLINGLDKIKINKIYSSTESELSKGKKTEDFVIALLNLLNLDGVYHVERYTILDCIYQVDILVKKDDEWLGFQVKSGQYNFNKHRKNSTVGVILCTQESESLKLLLALSEWLNVSIKDSVIDELHKWRQVKQMEIKTRTDRRLKLFNLDWKLLTLLKLVKFNGEVLVY